jgi:hypothetical protein
MAVPARKMQSRQTGAVCPPFAYEIGERKKRRSPYNVLAFLVILDFFELRIDDAVIGCVA